MQSGLGSQSWAQWLAEAMELPYRRLAVNGAKIGDVVRDQVPRLRPATVGVLYIGVNDVRELDWDTERFARGHAEALRAMADACERVLTATIPLDLGLPPAGAKVLEANEAIEASARAVGAVVADLRDFTGPKWVWADRVHATAAGQVEIADRAARALGVPLPSQTVVDVPRPDGWYAFHYAKRTLREHARAAIIRARS
jgi:hypothetical protein